MNKLLKLLAIALLLGSGLSIFTAETEAQDEQPASHQPLDPAFAQFVAAKKAQIKTMATDQHLSIPTEVWEFFDAIENGEATAATNVFNRLSQKSGRYVGSTGGDSVLRGKIWQPVGEVGGAYEQLISWNGKLMHRYGDDLIGSIPSGSIYFGGTDPGRDLISALSESQIDGKPFFTITQNQLADGTYLEYVRDIYGKKLYIPTAGDSDKCFAEYMKDVQGRLDHDTNFPAEPKQIKPGENVKMTDKGVQVSGTVAVMAVNGLLAKVIFDKNLDREFYVEESFRLDWMYPYLTPNGLIMKLNRKPVGELSDETIDKDHQYWSRYVKRLIGNQIRSDTPVRDVCAFVERVYLKKDYSEFEGDPDFVKNSAAQKTFSKLRSAIAGIYDWRSQQTEHYAERERMLREADLAYRQAFALCPYSPEAVYWYVALLIKENRLNDALLVASTWQKLDPASDQAKALVKQLEGMQKPLDR